MHRYVLRLVAGVLVSSATLFGSPGLAEASKTVTNYVPTTLPALAHTKLMTWGLPTPDTITRASLGQPNQSNQARLSGATIIEVGSTEGWVQMPATLVQGNLYTLKAAGRWTVDYRSLPEVGPTGYDSATDKTIYQDCRFASYPYGRLLGKLGNGDVFSVGEDSILSVTTSGPLFLRINDADACLGDNDGSVFVGITTGVSDSSSPPPVTPDDIKKALLCGLSAAKENISDKDLYHAITFVLLGRDLAEVRDNLKKMFETLGISLVPFDKCFEPYTNPPPLR